jgi:hypothetical protein
MKKTTFAIGILLTATMFAAGSMFSACGSKSGTTGAAGTGGGAAGTGGGAAGTGGGAAGTGGGAATKPDGTCVSGAFKHDGVCACQPDIPTVCPTVGCVDTKIDNDNCGGCGKPCGATSTCVAGACTPAPAAVVPASTMCAVTVGVLDLGISIAVSGGNLYVANAGKGTVMSYPVAGGPGTMIATGEMAPHALAVAGTTVAWISSVEMGKDANMNVIVSSTLKAAKTTGGAAATTLAMGMNIHGGIQGLVLSADGMTVYFSKDNTINSIPAAGGAIVNVGNEDHGGIPGALALSGTKLSYPTGLNGDVDIMTIEAGKVASCGINGPDNELDPAKQINCLRVARSQGSLVLATMASNATKAFWADGSNLKANLTAPGSAQSNENLAQAADDITSIVVTATNVYFGYGENVDRLALTPAAVSSPIVRGQKDVSSLAVDAAKVYWGSNGDCSVNSTSL